MKRRSESTSSRRTTLPHTARHLQHLVPQQPSRRHPSRFAKRTLRPTVHQSHPLQSRTRQNSTLARLPHKRQSPIKLRRSGNRLLQQQTRQWRLWPVLCPRPSSSQQEFLCLSQRLYAFFPSFWRICCFEDRITTPAGGEVGTCGTRNYVVLLKLANIAQEALP
jgi:hypothetical protein